MSEKRQFKIYSSRHIIDGENKYILLFDLLDKMETYEADELISTLLFYKKNTAYVKADMNFLYQLLLKSLIIFHSGKSAQIIVNESISIIEILYFKGNFEQCIKEIQKAASIARETELFSSLIKILQFEKMVLSHLQGYKRTSGDIVNEMVNVNHIHSNIIEYLKLYDEASLIRIKISKTRNIRDIKDFDRLMKHPLMTDEQKAYSIESKIRYYQIYAMWCYVHGNKKDELTYNRKIIILFDKHRLYKEEHLMEYVNTYSRILSISKELDEAVFFLELKNVRNIIVLSEKLYHQRISAQIFNFSYMIELSMYLQKKQFAKATLIMSDIENGLKKYKNILISSYKITFLYMQAYYYFITGNFDMARKKINTLLNEFKEEDRPDLYNFSRLLNLLIHFELKNYSYIKYKRASVHYYFRKQSSAYETENIILKFFSKESNYTDNLDKSLHNLYAVLKNVKSHSLEKYAFNYIDFLDWIQSKIAKKSSISKLYP